MEGFTIADGVALVIIVVSALLAYSRGFVREVLAILGWVGAAVAAFYFAPQVEPLIREIPYVKDVVASSCQLSILGAFALVFAAALIILSIFTPLFAAAVQESALGPIDRGLGFLFGVARGVLLVLVALVVYGAMGLKIPEIDSAKSLEIFAGASESLKAQIPTAMPDWIQVRVDQLLGNCDRAPGVPALTPAPAAPPATTASP